MPTIETENAIDGEEVTDSAESLLSHVRLRLDHAGEEVDAVAESSIVDLGHIWNSGFIKSAYGLIDEMPMNESKPVIYAYQTAGF
jgi:hypothetical protein